MSKTDSNKEDFMSLEELAAQLRKPSGKHAEKVAHKMNESNAAMYDLCVAEMADKKPEQLLEIGFGNGRFFDKLFAAFPDIKICGLDFSADMVESANRIQSEKVLEGKLELIQGDSSHTPYADSSFDTILCVNLIYFWQDVDQHLCELRRILKDGGRFYCCIRNKESMQKLPFTAYNFKIYTEEEWTQQLTQNGFRLIRLSRQTDQSISIAGSSFVLDNLCFVAEKC